MILRYLAKQSADAEPEKNLVFHTGTKANQQLRAGLADMRCKALGLRKSDGTTLSVVTQELANSAITVVDRAIGRALKQQTIIGAMNSRLEYTAANSAAATVTVTVTADSRRTYFFRTSPENLSAGISSASRSSGL